MSNIEKVFGEKSKIYKKVQMTPELENLLRDNGYEQKQNSTEYIIAPNETMSRKSISELTSEAFCLLSKKLNLPEEKKFKHLRKTYATKCHIEDPVNFYKRFGHTNPHTTLAHYVDMITVMEHRVKEMYKERNIIRKKGSNKNDSN
ncbi:MAG: hypothetical protein K0B10_06800 [Vicingaceae bacterium]|nr:hypothetical protein [Vicingaceae bacterium]